MSKLNGIVLEAVFFFLGGALLIVVVYFIVKRFRSRSREHQEKRAGGSEFIDSARSRTIISKDIPRFEIPCSLVPVPIQQPHRDVRAETDPSNFATNEYKPGLLPRSNHVTHVQGTFSPPKGRTSRSSSFQLELEETTSHSYDRLTPRQRRKDAVHEKLPTKVGRLEFSVYYDLSQKLLNINISRISKLKREELPDTKMIVSLICKGKQLWHDKTRTVKRNFNPQFNQKLEAYGIDSKNIRESVLLFQAFDEQSDSLMGETEYSLHELPNNKLVTQICALESGDLLEKDDEVDDVADEATLDRGELNLELCYNPSEQKLIVRIAEAKNLPLIRGSKPDAFVKLEVHFCGRKLQTRTTKVIHKTQNPSFNEIFILDLSNDKLPQVTLMLKVKNKGRVRETHIGQVQLGYSVSVESEYRHWEKVVDKPQMSIEGTHKIRKHH